MVRGPVLSCCQPTMQPNLVDNCLANSTDPSNTTALVVCVANTFQSDVGARLLARTVMLVFAAAMVFFMQAGFAMLCAGAVRKKNVQNTLLKNLLDACGASVAFFSVGYAFAFGGYDPTSAKKTFVGHANFFLYGVEDLAFWMFQYAFSAASATIIAGTLAERCQMIAYFCYALMLCGWVYPIIVHAIWNPQGFLSANAVDPLFGVGMIDFAGSGVVHLTGGITALYATIILGPRRGRFHDETGRKLDVPRDFPGHSISLQMLGTFCLWFGWYGFNAGSALTDISNPNMAQNAALAGVNTTLSGGSAGITALFLNLWILERYTGEPYFDLKYAMNGALSGLVAITAGCAVLEPWGAVVTGVVSGAVYIIGTKGLLRLRLDDAVDAIPVHMCAGIWGLLSVGLFASPNRIQSAYGRSDHPGWFYSLGQGHSDGSLLACQVVGMLFIISWVGVIMFPFFIWLDWRGWFRSDPLEEIVGLDTSYHGGLALLAGEEEVHPEFISAYKKQKEDNLRNRGKFGRTPETFMGDSDNGNGEVLPEEEEGGDGVEDADVDEPTQSHWPMNQDPNKFRYD